MGTAAKKLVLLSTVVVDWPGLRLAVVAVPPRLSASAIRAPPCMIPKRLLRSSRATSSAVTRSGDTWVTLSPRNSAKGGCLFAASFICLLPAYTENREGRGRYRPRPHRAILWLSALRLRNDANVRTRGLETLRPDFLGFIVTDRSRNYHILTLFPIRGRSDAMLGGHLQRIDNAQNLVEVTSGRHR